MSEPPGTVIFSAGMGLVSHTHFEEREDGKEVPGRPGDAGLMVGRGGGSLTPPGWEPSRMTLSLPWFIRELR